MGSRYAYCPNWYPILPYPILFFAIEWWIWVSSLYCKKVCVLIHSFIQFNSIQFNSIQFNSIQFNSIHALCGVRVHREQLLVELRLTHQGRWGYSLPTPCLQHRSKIDFRVRMRLLAWFHIIRVLYKGVFIPLPLIILINITCGFYDISLERFNWL